MQSASVTPKRTVCKVKWNGVGMEGQAEYGQANAVTKEVVIVGSGFSGLCMAIFS